MPPLQAVQRTAKGIFRQYNPAHEIPEGAVYEAENCTLDREGIFGPRRGFKRYGTAYATYWRSLFEFDDHLLAHSGTTLAYDSDDTGTWTAFTGTYAPTSDVTTGTDPYGIVRGFQARGNFYLVTNSGVQVTSEYTTAPASAGVPPGLDLQLSLLGGSPGWFQPDEASHTWQSVAYRITWGRITPLGTLIEGAPSMRETIELDWVAATWAAAGSTVTVTQTGHGYETGDVVAADSLSDVLADPTGTITKTGANTYYYTAVGSPAATGTGNFQRVSNIKIRFSVPDGLHAGDFYSIYKTAVAANEADPGDEQKRVTRVPVTAPYFAAQAVALAATTTTVTVTYTAHGLVTGDVVWMSDVSDSKYENGPHEITYVSADTFTYTVSVNPPATGTANIRFRTITYSDGLNPAFLGENLYTNPSLETIVEANVRPPWCRDAVVWKDYGWYLSTKREQYVDIQSISVSSLVDATSYLKLNYAAASYSETYTFNTTSVYSTRNFKRDTSLATDSLDIRATMKNLCMVINRSSAYWYAWYTSGEDEAPGQVTIEMREYQNASYTTSAFYLTCNNATTSVAFSPNIPTSGTYMLSDDFRLLHGIYYSKQGQPEAVPDGNFEETFGEPSKEGLRLIPTRDSLFVVKEDGIFRVSGDTERTFSFKPLDTTVFGRAPNSWVALDNSVWGLSTKGIVRITESGTEIMSKPVEPEISELLDHPLVDTLCHAVAYESDGIYILFAPELSTDTVCTIAWVFPADGSTGPTMWRLKTYGSLIKFRENKLYVTSASDDDHVMVERKNYDDEDYMDEEIECTVDSVSTYVDAELGTLSVIEVTWPALSAGNVDFVPTSGCIFQKTPSSLPWTKIREASEVEGSAGKYVLKLSHYMPGLTTGMGIIGRSIPVILTWHEEVADNAAMLKSFSFAQLYFEDAKISRAKLGFLADTETSEYTTDDLLVESIEDTTTCFRTIVPHTHAVCRGLRLKFLHSVAQEPWDLLQRSLEFRPLTWIAGESPR